jgi:hypothetical protein
MPSVVAISRRTVGILGRDEDFSVSGIQPSTGKLISMAASYTAWSKRKSVLRKMIVRKNITR